MFCTCCAPAYAHWYFEVGKVDRVDKVDKVDKVEKVDKGYVNLYNSLLSSLHFFSI